MGFSQTSSKWETERKNLPSEERRDGASNTSNTATAPTLGQELVIQVNSVQIRALDISMGRPGLKPSVEVEKHCGIILRNLGDELFNRSLSALNLEGLAPPTDNDRNHRGRHHSDSAHNV